MERVRIVSPTIFGDRIIAGITLRSPMKPDEIGFTVKESNFVSLEEAESNRMRLADTIGIPPNRVKYQKQTHSVIIRQIQSDSAQNEADGMITHEAGTVLAVKVADCAAVLLFDAARGVVCGLHSGWRGTAQNIVRHGIEKLRQKYSSRPSDLLAWISPCAGGDAYEVGTEVAQHFPRSSRPIGNGKFLFDNKNEIRLQLLDCGVDPSRIEASEVCTISDSDYHSYRRDGERSGRMAAFIGMKA